MQKKRESTRYPTLEVIEANACQMRQEPCGHIDGTLADYIKLVLIAVVIASPIAWWAMNRWLADLAYRIDI